MAKKTTVAKKIVKTAAKPAKKAVVKKAVTRQPVKAKAPVAKAVKKSVAKKPVKAVAKPAKKAVVKKAVAKAPVAKAVKKSVAKKSAAAKKPAKAAAPSAKKTVVKKATAPKAAVTKKSVAKKPAVKKAAVKKAAASKPAVAKKPAVEKAAVNPEKAKPVAAPAPAPDNMELAYGIYDGIEVCAHPKPFPKKSPYSAAELKALRNRLEQERARLRQILRGLDNQTLPRSEKGSNAVTPGYSTHLAENATDNIDTETTLMLRRDEEAALFQVETALDRLEEGIFGVCLGCGDKIGMSRLRVVPEAHLCMQCKQVYDKKKSGRQ